MGYQHSHEKENECGLDYINAYFDQSIKLEFPECKRDTWQPTSFHEEWAFPSSNA